MRKFVEQDWTPGYINACPLPVDIVVECTTCGARRKFEREALPPILKHPLINDIEPRLKGASCEAKRARMLFSYSRRKVK